MDRKARRFFVNSRGHPLQSTRKRSYFAPALAGTRGDRVSIMSNVLIVVDKLEDWEPYYPSEHVISFEQYLALKTPAGQRVRVVNLCCDYSCLSQGYYCSLRSEARGHHVIPPSRVPTA